MILNKTIVSCMIVSLLFVYNCASSQVEEAEIELYTTKVLNSKLDSIVVQKIEHEKKCDYYNDSLIFNISVYELEDNLDNYEIIISSTTNKNIALSIDPYGYFYKDKHLFLIDGDASKILFSRSNDKNKFLYISS